MRAARFCFNLLLAVVLVTALAQPGHAGQATNAPAAKSKKEKKPKPIKMIRVHVESKHDLPERSVVAALETGEGLKINVEKLPILNESHMENAALLDSPGGYQLRLKFNSLGAKILESYTSAAVGRHLAVVCDVDGEARWLGLPLVRQRIGDGVLTFSPAVPRDIVVRLVDGLNGEIQRQRKQWLN